MSSWDQAGLVFFTVCVSVHSGHAIPSASCGGEAGGDRATDASSQEGTKSMLVMSGGEGYIDFRMGEFTAWKVVIFNYYISAVDWENMLPLCVSRWRGGRGRGRRGCPNETAALPGQSRAQPPYRVAGPGKRGLKSDLWPPPMPNLPFSSQTCSHRGGVQGSDRPLQPRV